MNGMFYGCESLNKLNLANFQIENNTDVSCLFHECKKLKKSNVISKSKRILVDLK
jgi:surface protein